MRILSVKYPASARWDYWFGKSRQHGGRDRALEDYLRWRWYKIRDRLERWKFRYDAAFYSKPAPPCPRQAEATMLVQMQHKTRWERDGTCSYCGSLSEEAFFEAVAAGAEVGPTDKSYKAYLHGPKAPRVRGAAKFYFQHLSDEGRTKFISLYNEKRMNIGAPGHFYVRPYFCKPLEAQTDAVQ